MKICITTFLIICALASFAQIGSDIIIYNARITTLDPQKPEVSAVAIADDSIVAVGSNEEILQLAGNSTTRIDAKGKRIVPGLFDSHLHVVRGGRFYNSELRWDGVTTLKRALQMLKEQAERTPSGQWVRVVGGWSEHQFAEKRLPTVNELNEASGNTPMFVLYLYGKAWLNKAGLDALKINASTENPIGGIIQRNSHGEPTGLLIAEPNAFILYSTLARLPQLSYDEKVNSIMQYMSELNRLGVTAVMDAGGGFQNFPDDYRITDSLYRQNLATLRLPYFLFAQKRGSELKDYQNWITTVDISSQESGLNYSVEGGGENLVAEAADFENFLFPRPELPVDMEQKLKPIIQLLVKNRWPFRLHATYNESITRDLDVIEAVDKETPLNGLTWFFDHAETVSEENLKRIKSLGGGIAIQHRMAYQGESFIQRYGLEKAKSAPPVKKMLELGIPVGLGTDGTRVASYNPWLALYWITTGKTVGGTQVMDKMYTLDRATALELLTVGGYRLIKQDIDKGRIKKGYKADLIILSEDYFEVTDDEIKKIKSMLTILDGKIVWGNPAFYAGSPKTPPVIPNWSPVKFHGGYQEK